MSIRGHLANLETIERYGKLFVAAVLSIVETYTTAPAVASSASWKTAVLSYKSERSNKMPLDTALLDLDRAPKILEMRARYTLRTNRWNG